jgi:hypothetical protein
MTNMPLAFSGSNFIGRFPQLSSYTLTVPQVGGGNMAPPTNEYEKVWISMTGSNGWTQTTNKNLNIATNVWVSVVGDVGNSGSISLFGVDKTELLGRTNSFFGQHFAFDTPQLSADAATKSYVDGSVAGCVSPFSTMTGTNSIFHLLYAHDNQTLIDVQSSGNWIHIDSFNFGAGYTDESGVFHPTNALLGVTATNLGNGFIVQSSTNLALANGWNTITNWTVSMNSGEAIFTLPVDVTLEMQFFRVEGSQTNNIILAAPVTLNGQGSVLQIYAQTNTPMIADLGNQRGLRLWASNGVFWITGSTNGTTTYTRQIEP